MNINTKSTHDIQGFEALIDSRMEYPLMSGEKILIRPGHAVGKFQCIFPFDYIAILSIQYIFNRMRSRWNQSK